MKTFVVIPSFMRAKDTLRCLESLARQSTLPAAVCVIVRDTDTESMVTIIDKGWPFRFIREVITIPGQVAALNRGLDTFFRSEADIVTILDDDVELPADWIAKTHKYFSHDAALDGLGGRDHIPEVMEKPDKPTVGKLTFYGKLIGNHHLGTGEVREVDSLKGCNMTFRRAAIEGLRFSTVLRGKGVQMGNDTEFTLQVKSRGKKICYDPSLVLTHYTSARSANDDRDPFVSLDVLKCNSFNYTYINLLYLPWYGQPIFLFWWIFVGTRNLPGLIQLIRFKLFHSGKIKLSHLWMVWSHRTQAYLKVISFSR